MQSSLLNFSELINLPKKREEEKISNLENLITDGVATEADVPLFSRTRGSRNKPLCLMRSLPTHLMFTLQ